jgi:AGCS family alanine or glycine:cation symporter
LLRALFTALFLLFAAVPSTARADEPAPEPTAFEKADAAFAQWVVGPLATVMFFDLVFWDDVLPADQAQGTVHDGKLLVRPEGAGWWVREQSTSADPVVKVLDEPLDVKLGSLDAKVRSAASRRGGEEVWGYIASVPSQPVDLAALELSAEVPQGDNPVVEVRGLAPFPVKVDRSTARTVPIEVSYPVASVPLQVGDVVRASDGSEAEVAAIDEAGVTLLAPERLDPELSVPNRQQLNIPVVVAWLVVGAIFFTLRMAFVNLRMFPHAIAVVSGRYDDDEEEGEISHFQALSSALSATVGLGNISGVAIAVAAGGPGAVFWMVMAGFLGMSSKFTECTLGQMYRHRRADGSVSGGPMHYLDEGLAELGVAPLGKVLAVIFALMCVGGSLGGGNMFQANQSFAAVFDVATTYGLLDEASRATTSVVYGIVLAFVVGLVIIGGIKRIGAAAGVIVPFMCAIYLLAGCAVLIVNAAAVPAAFAAIVREAFTPMAGLGGMAGVLIQGFRRAAFSNEAGVGSASIAHSAATTNYPVREGIVALLEPFIDTIVVCTMTGLVVVVTGAYKVEGIDGVVMTSTAFGSVLGWFPVVLSIAVLLFAFSTMISWSYYGERCITWLFGDAARLPYRILFLVCVFAGSVFHLGSVLDFSDLMILGMAFPNILGAILLSGKVKAALDDYIAKLKSGAFA